MKPTQSFWLEKASSKKAFEQCWGAYEQLSETEKRKILKFFHKKLPNTFARMLQLAKLPRGAMTSRVESREGNYGEVVDKFLKSFEEGRMGAKVLLLYLFNSKGAPGKPVLEELRNCPDTSSARKALADMAADFEDEPMKLLVVRYIEAYVNLKVPWIGNGSAFSDEFDTKEAEDSVMDVESSEEGLVDGELEEQVSEEQETLDERESGESVESGGGPVTNVLDQALDHISRLSEKARTANSWDEDEWKDAVAGAKDAVTKVHAEVERLATAAGRDFPEWKTREQLDGFLEELKDADAGRIQREELIKFLKSLEAIIRSLTPVHKLSSKREKLAKVQNAAAEEIHAAQNHDCVQWVDGGPCEAREWLHWVMQLDESGLEHLISSLTDGPYSQTARLVEDLEQGYELGVDQGVETESKGATQEEEQKPSPEEPIAVTTPISDESRPSSPSPKTKIGERFDRPSPAPTKEGHHKTSDTTKSTQQKDSQELEFAKCKLEEGRRKDYAPVSGKESNLLKEAAKANVESAEENESSRQADFNPSDEQPWQEEDGADVSEEVFEPIGDLATTAATAIVASEAEVESTIEKIVWNLLAKGERAIAFEVLNNANETGLTNAFPLHSNALEILALLPAYSSNSSEVPHRIRTILQSEDFTAVFKDGEPKANHLRRLLLASALLRPSLFDPSSSAGAVLDGVRLGKFPSLHRIANALTEFGRKGVDLNATILLATRNTKGWREAENEFVEAVQRFQDGALARKMNYAPATWIWRHWFQHQGGWMRALFGLAANQDRKSLEKLALDLKSVNVEDEIRKGWEESNKRGHLVGMALESLRRLSSEAIDLLSRRLDHWRSGPDHESDYRHTVLEDLADTVASNLASARKELGQMADAGQPFDERNRIAVDLVHEELDRLSEALEGTNPQVQCPSLREWLHVDLMRLDSVEIDNDMEVFSKPYGNIEDLSGFWKESDPARIRLASELLALRNPIQNCEQAFDGALARSDHQKARWILDQLARIETPGLGEIEIRKASHLEETRNRLRRELKAVEGELGSAFSKGWVTPDAHAELLELIHRRLQNLSDRNEGRDFSYHLWGDDVTKVKQVIRKAHEEQVCAAELSLKNLDHASPGDIERVKGVLSKGNVHLANEYILRLIAGESIKHNEDTSPNQFFADLYGDSTNPGHFVSLQELISSPSFNPLQAIADIQNNETWCGIDLQRLDSTSRSASASALQRWFSAQRSKKIDEKGVEVILRALDFPITNISHTRDVFVAHLAGVIPCPIPDYGSEIRSSKIVVIVELQRTSIDDVAQYLDRLKLGTNPIILLWMRPIGIQQRRKFARICRQKSIKVLMVDSILASYLLTVESQRLRALFECGLPFTNVSPYTTTGGMLPEEMFYGRRREIEAIESAGQSGTCFVYGGRQIGKTVLLRKVEMDFPRSGTHHLALYLDLNFHAVGQTVAMDEIWKIVADELSKKDPTIFAKKITRTQFTVENFAERVTEWLQENDERRILLLLDESDQFLRSDGDAGDQPGSMPFQICQKLKGLMDKTHRRFKVVFAGLHNVQRSTRVANNPLAQLGIPVCVGPLHQNGEAREAGRLVSVPLAVSGVFFDSSDTINSILARTNYYPNLIQILCTNLLRTIVDRQGNSHPDQTPPYQVTSEDVERIFANYEVRDELRKKFMLTLDLDLRFSLVAHHMAFTANDMPDGFTVDDIQRDAVTWWPAGFEADRQRANDSLREELVLLLNEMCGLGILRRDANDHYFLRSPNVVSLLGSPNDIVKVLEAASEWDVAPPYSPDSFRTPTTAMGGRCHWRSPLTARQETLIRDPKHQIVVIAGCPASGIREVQDRIQSMMGEDYIIPLSDVQSAKEFDVSFTRLRKREDTGKTVLLVPSGSGWNLEWMAIAKRRLGQFTAKDRAVGVVFLADSSRIWELLPEWKAIGKEVGTGHLKLQRWDNAAVRQWLADTGLLSENLRQIHDMTGGWHEVIHTLGDYVRGGRSIDSLIQSQDEVLRLFREKLPLKTAFGLPEGIAVRALEILGQLEDPVSDEFLHELYGAMVGPNECKKIAPTLEWAEAVDLVANTPEGWRIDPLVGKLLTEGK